MDSPLTLVLFGATGDLAQKKLFPALLSLFTSGQLPSEFQIIGFARREFTDEAFRELVEKGLSVRMQEDPHVALSEDKTPKDDIQNFLSHISYQQGQFDDARGYEALANRLSTNACVIFYLATPPEHYENILMALHNQNLAGKQTRIAIEKPFGNDLVSAQALDNTLASLFSEDQIFRVDHYLGKEVLQNILFFRFANTIFEPVWCAEYIDCVQLTFHEASTITGRGKFFDGVGILRDIGQNHLMQMMASVVMEQPKSFTKEAVRDVRTEAIRGLRIIAPEDIASSVVRGQYEGYREEKDVVENSQTETSVALKFFVDTPRFMGVPFYLRAAKAMEKPEVSISIVFKQYCHILFKEVGCPEFGNVLTFHIQPHEGIALSTVVKTPGTKPGLASVPLHFSYKETYGHTGSDAYEKILLDVINGDQMLFNRSDELSYSWKFITEILRHWENAPLHPYTQGSETIDAIHELIKKDGREWVEE